MRWYVQQNGETVGPVDEQTVALWLRQGGLGPSTLLAAEGTSQWLPIQQSPFMRATAPAYVAKKSPVGIVLLALFAIGAAALGTCGAYVALSAPSPPVARTVPGSAPADTAERAHPCEIRRPDAPHDKVTVFPTESGFDEWTKAAVDNSTAKGDLGVIAEANDAFLVNPGTRCSRLDGVFSTAHVRILSGDRAGESGYLPMEWTR